MKESAVFTQYSAVNTVFLRWLWEPYIAFGKVTLMLGETAESISYLLYSLALGLSSGKDNPSGEKYDESYHIIYQSSIETTAIKQSLEMLGADCTKISYIEGMPAERLDIDILKKAVAESHAKVLIIDPVSAYRPSKSISKKPPQFVSYQEINKLKQLAIDNQCAVILTGFLKNQSERQKSEYERSSYDMNSLSCVRSILYIEQGKEEKNTYILRQIKNNLASEGHPFRFSIDEKGNVTWQDKPTDDVSIAKKPISCIQHRKI